MMNNLLIRQLEVGPMQNYIYFVGDKSTNDVVVIDPAWDVKSLLKYAQDEKLNIKSILITHGHFDHTNGVEEILNKLDIPVYINKHEADFFRFPWGTENIKIVNSAEKIVVGNTEIEFIHTPGHTPGSQCFRINKNLVSGDTLFINGCGRCDLPGGDPEQMFDTIYNKLMKMDDDTIIYPGHNYSEKKHDTVANQRITNPYMQYDNLMNFIKRRMPK